MKNDIAAVVANQSVHDAMVEGEYASLAPHLFHETVRGLYTQLVDYVYSLVSSSKSSPLVLDLGAGDGTATIPFLEKGARVLAVDISEKQLSQLREKCKQYGSLLNARRDEMLNVLKEGGKFDVIVMNSVLHHIPDYLEVVNLAMRSLSENGVFMSFQDPMWSSSISIRDTILTNATFFAWRVRRDDVLGGMWRRFKRLIGIYSATSKYDNTEYHGVRDGVNQIAIRELFVNVGFECRVIEYCSFQSGEFQLLGERLRVKNTFAIVAGRAIPDSQLFNN